MCTKNYENMLIEINDKIINKKLKYDNFIILGDNSSGKSALLKMYLEKSKMKSYFIDSTNRIFDYKNISKRDLINSDYKNVVVYRLQENIFNLVDSFNFDKTGMGRIEDVYFNFEDEIKLIIKEFLDIDFEIIEEKNDYTGKSYNLKLDGEIDKLSSGYQAIIRIFIELLYFEEMTKKFDENKIVVIDEINEFLSTKNEEKILPFLMNRFPNFNFIITTHSADVIASSIDCNLIILDKNNQYNYLDGNDFITVTDVREIFHKLYEITEKNKNSDIESILRNLLSIKISDCWTDVEENKLKIVSEEKLTNAQKLILNQIKSW